MSATDADELQRAYNEEPDGGYQLVKRMANGTLRVYGVRVTLEAPPLGGADA